jgi:hypothetical protein
MNGFSTWMQTNWYALGNLLAQFAFLTAGVWFAQKILRALRATQEQFGALLRLSMTDGLSERAKAAEAAHRSLWGTAVDRPSPYVMAEWPALGEAPTLSLPEREPRGKRVVAAGRAAIQWLQTPMSGHWLVPWRKVTHWLQTPAGN